MLCQAGLPWAMESAQMEKVAHVGEDLHGTAAGAVEVGEGFGCIFQGANGAVGQCGKGVAEKIPFFIHGGTIAHGMGA